MLLDKYPDEECLRNSYLVFKKKSLTSHQGTIGQLLIKKLANSGKWHEIPNLFNEKNLPKTILNNFSEVLALEVAGSREFRKTTLENKNAIAVLLKKLFIDAPWQGTVPMRVAGAAIESAYKIIDALEFYEGVWKKGRILEEKPDDVNYAIARWVKSKLRLAKLQEEEGKYSTTEKHRAEAENICRSRLGINKDDIPDEPEFSVIGTRDVKIISKVLSSVVPQYIRDAVLDLHKIGRTSLELSEIFSIDVDIVVLIVKGDV